ncbi:MAG: hypothetical protein QXL69_01385 [Candidatus Bathyarchaeia archaeon]
MSADVINVSKNVKTVEEEAKAIRLTPKQIIKSLVYISEKAPDYS